MAVPFATVSGPRNRRQSGVALVTALLVVALASVAAVAMATRLHVDVRRSTNLLHGEQAYAYARAAESWAQVILRRDAGDNESDSVHDDWATALPPIAVEGGLVDGEVHDLQGRFNVNNLLDNEGAPDPVYMDYFRRMLDLLKLDPDLVTALVDWMDADINAGFPGGAEDENYLLADPPYRAANQPLADISELRLIEGFTPDVVALLAPHVTALPSGTPINVNTATAVVLQALDPGLDEAAVESLLEARADEVFDNQQAFEARPELAGLDPQVLFGVESEWFQVLTDVVVGGGRARVRSVIHREDQTTRVVSRLRGRHALLPLLGG